MNSLDFYLAQLFGCKRDVARVAGKVGGLTDCVFTGLCGALPEAKGKGDGTMIGGNSGYFQTVICASVIVIIALFIHSCSARRSVAATQTADQTAEVILLREMEYSDGRRYVFEYDEHCRVSRRAYYHDSILVELMAYTYSEDLIRSFDYVLGYGSYNPLFRKQNNIISFRMPTHNEFEIELNAEGFPIKRKHEWRGIMYPGWSTTINNFTWENGNLIKANNREFGENWDGRYERFDTVAYTYDNMKSPFSLCATPRWFVWWLFGDCSVNNVMSKDTVIYEYTYNEYGLRATQKQGSNTIMYTYMKQASNSLLHSTFANENNLEDELATSIMTMTTNDNSVRLTMSGTGTVTIDWGDGSEIETAVFDEQQMKKAFEHRYNHPDAQLPRNITIKGENITLLQCRSNQISELNVSQNTSLVYLDVSFKHFTCDALNALFDSLHDKDFLKGINISENLEGGASPCNIGIAEAKGWSVQTKF